MSRVRRLSYAITEHGRRANATNQALALRDKVSEIIEEANSTASVSRRVTKRAAFTVVLRSLQATKNLPFSQREYVALKDLAQFINLAQNNKVTSLTLSHTDLLPVSHPRSTKEHAMTASALKQARIYWVTDDTRIVNEKVKTILASALSAEHGSTLHKYSMALLYGLPQGSVPLDAITAAMGDGNSRLARSIRAMKQRRDRLGQFAFQGGGFKALFKNKDGKFYHMTGRQVAEGDSDTVQVEMPDGRIAQVPVAKGEFIKAVLPQPDGYVEPFINPSVAELKYAVDEDSVQYVDAPNGWEYSQGDADAVGKPVYSDGAFFVIISEDDNGKKEYAVYSHETGEDVILSKQESWAGVQDSLRGNEDALAGGEAAKSESKSKTEKTPVAEIPQEAPQPAEGKAGVENGKFVFKYPEGALKIKSDNDYNPEGPQGEDSEDFTDDPSIIANKFPISRIKKGLEAGVLPEGPGKNASGYGVLKFSAGDEFVPAEALYSALQESGEDHEMILAQIYDKANGDSDNEDALNEFRRAQGNNGEPDVADSFKKSTKGTPDEPVAEIPAEEPKSDLPLPALIQGASEEEQADYKLTGDHTPFLPKNEEIQLPEGSHQPDPAPYTAWKKVTKDNPDEALPEGFDDNPVTIAQIVPTKDLQKSMTEAVAPGADTPGYAEVELPTNDGEPFKATLPVEAVRDALQLQGIDTNAELQKIADEGAPQLPLDIAEPPKKLNAYEQLMKDKQDRADAVTAKKEKLKADAEARIDAQGNPVPEGWDISTTQRGAGFGAGYGDPHESQFSNMYRQGSFAATMDDSGQITVWDYNGIVAKKKYASWDELQADLPKRKDEYADGARVALEKMAAKYNFPKEVISEFDLMTAEQIKDFFNNPENYTPEFKAALDDYQTSSAVDLPTPDQKKKWAEFGATWRLADQAGDFATGAEHDDAVAKLPNAPAEDPNPYVGPEENTPAPTPAKPELDVRAMLDEEEALADKYQQEEEMDRGDAQAVAEADVKAKYGKTAIEALNDLPREDALQILNEREGGVDKVEKKTTPTAIPQDFEVDAQGEIPDGNEALPQPADVAPVNADGAYRITAKVSDLQPGDITVGDHFVIESIGANIPGTDRLQIVGHYPGHVSQDTKQWNHYREIEVIRGVQAPVAGSGPVLSKPKEKDFGKRKKNADGTWGFADAEAQTKFDAAMAEYNIQLDAAKAGFKDPTADTNKPHRITVAAQDIQPGDISADPLKGHFVIERTFVDADTKPGFVSVEGYYPGHVTQRKEWKQATKIDVIRNVTPPAKGELPDIHQPFIITNGKWRPDNDPAKREAFNKEIADLANFWKAPEGLPVVNNTQDAPTEVPGIENAKAVVKGRKPYKPSGPAFQGDMAALVREAGADWSKLKEAIKGQEFVFFDFETTGINPADGNHPWQVAAVRMKDGKVLDRINIYMNPGRSIKDTFAGGVGADGVPNAVDADGNPLSDDFLAKQPGQKEAMKQFFDWIGPNAILGSHNVPFDDEVARRMADEHGLEFAPAGYVDTLPIAQAIYKGKTGADKPVNNKLGTLAEYLGVKLDNWHAADADAEAAGEILNALIDDAIKMNAPTDILNVDQAHDAWVQAMKEYEAKLEKYDAEAADFAAAKAVNAAQAGEQLNFEEVLADAVGPVVPHPDGLPSEQIPKNDKEVVVLEFSPNAIYPRGKMQLMTPEWVRDDANTFLMDREDARMANILPGDFMFSKDGEIIWQVVAVRAGEDFGLNPGRVKIFRRNLDNGDMSTYEHWHATRLDGVRRAKNPEDLNAPLTNVGGKEGYIANEIPKALTPEQIKDIKYNNVYNIGDRVAHIKISAKDGGFFLEAALGEDGAAIYNVDGQYRTIEGAQAEGHALLMQHAAELDALQAAEHPEEAKSAHKDAPIQRGTLPEDAVNAPALIEVENLPADLQGRISIQQNGVEEPNFAMMATLHDADGDVVAQHEEDHHSPKEAEADGRDFIARSAEAVQNPNEEAPAPAPAKPKTKTKKQATVPSGEERAIKQNDWVEANAGDMGEILAEDVKVGDFFFNRFHGHYEEIIELNGRVPVNGIIRDKFTVFNIVNGEFEIRHFKPDSPLRNVRRPGEKTRDVVHEEVGVPRGGKRKGVKARPIGERVIAVPGRPMGGNFEEEGFFQDKNGVPVRVGDVVVANNPKMAAKYGKGIVKRRVGAQIEAGQKVGGLGRGGKVGLDYLLVVWENDEINFPREFKAGRPQKAKNIEVVKAGAPEPIAPAGKAPVVPAPVVPTPNVDAPEINKAGGMKGVLPTGADINAANVANAFKVILAKDLPKARDYAANDDLRAARKRISGMRDSLEYGVDIETAVPDEYLASLIRKFTRAGDNGNAKELLAQFTQFKQEFDAIKAEKYKVENERYVKELGNPFAADLLPADIKDINQDVMKNIIIAVSARIAVRQPQNPVKLSTHMRAVAYDLEYLKGKITGGQVLEDMDPEKFRGIAAGIRKAKEPEAEHIADFLESVATSLKAKQKFDEANLPAFGKVNMPLVDPIALAEQRINNGEGLFNASPRLRAVFADDLFMDNTNYLQPYKEDIQKFFATPGEQSFASLPAPARRALSQYMEATIRDRQTMEGANKKETDANIVEIATALKGLHDEHLAFNPHRDSLGAVGADILKMDPNKVLKIGRAANGKINLVIDGNDTGFDISQVDAGINAGHHFRLTHRATGQDFYFKQEGDNKKADSEVIASVVGRALGITGATYVEKHPLRDDVIVITSAGDSLFLKKKPIMFDSWQGNYNTDAMAQKIPALDMLGMAILDAAIANDDRHRQNFMAAAPIDMGVPDNGMLEVHIFPIDHGLADVPNGRRPSTPIDHIRGQGRAGGELNHAVAESMGATAYKSLVDMTIQQAILTLKRLQGPIVDPAIMNDILSRLGILLQVDVSTWKSKIAKKD